MITRFLFLVFFISFLGVSFRSSDMKITFELRDESWNQSPSNSDQVTA